ncbi:hypothetical protein Cgig2_014679 [Carnegiea gigantea]|uniref:DUF7026 domain-containing protein n=1 Tax=Carnegiea gigantea TaxID=171969 RepID=A0A9Q1L1Z0_9CARY|nr:hypothetical protein Cgig2_014679 [Carnegiea gigantea]
MLLTLRTPPPHFPSFTLPHPRKSKTGHFPCFSSPKTNDNDNNNNNKQSSKITGAPELAAEVMQRIKSQVDERENALKKSKQMLFFELCNSLNLTPEEGKTMWGTMSPDEKMALIKRFVSDWGLRSVRDMVEEYVAEDAEEEHSSDKNPNLRLSGSDSGVIFSGLKKLFMDLSVDE